VQRGGGRYQNGEANYGRPTIPLTVLIAEVMAKQDVSISFSKPFVNAMSTWQHPPI